MKKSTLTFFTLFISIYCAYPQSETFFYRVELKDKSQSTYSIGQPQAFLSEKALERRKRYGIKITENDLPVSPAHASAISQAGVEVLNKSKWFNSVLIETDNQVALQKIEQLPFVKKVTLVGTKSLLKAAEDAKFQLESNEIK